MRINLYFNEEEPKDQVIIEFLEKRYSPKGFIKEMLYGMATGESLNIMQNSTTKNEQPVVEQKETPDDYEEIKDSDGIEL